MSLRASNCSQKGRSATQSLSWLVIRRRKASSVSRAGSHSRVAPSTCTRVSKAALSTSAILTPQLSDHISFKTLRMLSAMSAGSPYSRKAKGFKAHRTGVGGVDHHHLVHPLLRDALQHIPHKVLLGVYYEDTPARVNIRKDQVL